MLVIDCETTGLKPFGGDKILGIAIRNDHESCYIDKPDPMELTDRFRGRLLIGHNIVFDLNFLSQAGVQFINCKFYDTEVGARLEYNAHMRYSLAVCGSRIGHEKSDKAKEYMDKYKLFSVVTDDLGNKKKDYHFYKIPLEILGPYAQQDTLVTLELYKHQQQVFQAQALEEIRSCSEVVELEQNLIPVLMEMQKVGLNVDIAYCNEAYNHEKARVKDALDRFKSITGLDLVDSAKFLKPILEPMGAYADRTESGRPSYTDETLERSRCIPAVSAVLQYRDANKRLSTYWSNYRKYTGKDGRIHPWLRSAGTTTGRFSCKEPNLQQVHKRDDSNYPVRKSFIPTPGYTLVSLDYQAQEYRLLADYAEEQNLIEKILSGLDVHSATAAMMGVDRDKAKTLNFALLYGAGSQKLANALNVSPDTAKQLKVQYFKALPKIKQFIYAATKRAEQRGYVFNWLGRRLYFGDPKYAYRAVNAIIQGGCADITKTAIVNLHTFIGQLATNSVRMLLTVHDEILFEVRNDSLHLVPEFSRIMREAYPHKNLPMEVSVSYSEVSWGDMRGGYPIAK